MNNQSARTAHTSSTKKWITVGAIVALFIVVGGFFAGRYNQLVGKQEHVSTAWSQVENQYQRRLDLIPNLVETVKGYASHERETLEGVINARANATKASIDPSKMTSEQLADYSGTQEQLSQALGRLMVVVERYPELKADENFRQLQAQLEGTENRIAVARKDFNESAKEYNTYRRKFPTNIVAGMFGFDVRPYFEASPEAAQAPKVQF